MGRNLNMAVALVMGACALTANAETYISDTKYNWS